MTRWIPVYSLVAGLIIATPAGVRSQQSPHVSGYGVECMDCHGFSTGGGMLHIGIPPDDEQEAMCKQCHAPGGLASDMSNVANHVVNNGNTLIACSTCHNPHAYEQSTDIRTGITAPNLKLIRSWIDPNRVPGVSNPVVYQQRPDHFAFADDDPPYQGICQACHTQTNHHTNDGSTDYQHGVGQDCTTCHRHDAQFLHGGATGTGCDSCHGKDADNGGTGTTRSHSTHTENDLDDQRGPYITCSVCHDTNNFPYFASGTDLNSDNRFDLSETDVCDTCHSPGGAYNGVDGPIIGAKINWETGVYAGDDLQTGKEKWCATCHDDLPSNSAPDGSGVLAPNVIGFEDAITEYGIGFGYYKTGHGLAEGFFPASGAPTAGIGCLDCHDSTAAHIDGEARTYNAGLDNYQAGYRLISIYGASPMEIPRMDWTTTVSDFTLCFECHSSDPYLVESDATTNFRDEDSEGTLNLHWYHLLSGGPYVNRWDSDWDGMTGDSQLSCTACHNVHGSPSPRMIRHGELISTAGTTDKVPALDFQYTPAWSFPELGFSNGGIIGTGLVGGGGGGTPASNGVCVMCHANKVAYTREAVVTTNGTAPNRPVNILPADMQIDVATNPILESSSFSDPDIGDTHVQSQWQVTDVPGDFSSPFYDSGPISDLTDHTVAVTLSNSTMFFWRVRYRDSNGVWSEYSVETSFITVSSSEPQSLVLHPTNGAAVDPINDPFTIWGCPDVPNDPNWEVILDSMDGDTSFVYRCCDAPGSTIYADMENPDPNGIVANATITGITVGVYARYALGGPNCREAATFGVIDIGFKTSTTETGTIELWKGDTSLDSSGDYNLVTYHYSGDMTIEQLNNLQVYVKRRTSGSPRLRITEVYVEIEYLP